MLHFQVNPNTGVPVYRQVMDQIKHYIAAGVLETGSRLPSIRELSRFLSVNPATIVKAYGELEHEGTIEMKHGKGAFVCEQARPMAKRELESALRRLVRPLAVEATQLGAKTDLVVRILEEEIRSLGGQ